MPFATYSASAHEHAVFRPLADIAAGTPTFVTPTTIGISGNDVKAGKAASFRISGIFQLLKSNPSEVISADTGLQFLAGLGVTAGSEPMKAIADSSSGELYVFARINPPGTGGGGGGNTDISVTPSPTALTINSSSGVDGTFPAATGTNAGAMLPAEKTKVGHITVLNDVDLDTVVSAVAILLADTHPAATNVDGSIAVVSGQELSVVVSPDAGNALSNPGNGLFATDTGGAGGATNISVTAVGDVLTVVSSSGTDGVFPLAVSGTSAGALSKDDKTTLNYLIVTGATDLDALNAASHAVATSANAAIANTPPSQVFTFTPDPAANNMVSVTGSGCLVKGILEVALKSNRPAATIGARVRVLSNRLIYGCVATGTWFPESLICVVDQTTFNSLSEMEEMQTIVKINSEFEARCYTWSTTNGLMEQFGVNNQSAAFEINPVVTIDADDVTNRWAQVLQPNQASSVLLFYQSMKIITPMADFIPSTGVLDWTATGKTLFGVAAANDVISGVYWKP